MDPVELKKRQKNAKRRSDRRKKSKEKKAKLAAERAENEAILASLKDAEMLEEQRFCKEKSRLRKVLFDAVLNGNLSLLKVMLMPNSNSSNSNKM